MAGRSALAQRQWRSPTSPGSDPREGTPSGRRDPKIFLGIGRPPKTLSDDVELKRGEIEDDKVKLLLLLRHET